MEIKKKDEEGEFNIREVETYIKALGDDRWRLPTNLTSSIENNYSLPLTFDFKLGRKVLSSDELKHNLRLVKNPTIEVKPSFNEFKKQVFDVIKLYVPDLSAEKFIPYLDEVIDVENYEKLKKINTIIFEDHNVTDDPGENYCFDLHSDDNNDMLSLWENNFFSSGYSIYDLEEDESLRDVFLGCIDLINKKYFRINGYGKKFEFGSKEIKNPNWSAWC